MHASFVIRGSLLLSSGYLRIDDPIRYGVLIEIHYLEQEKHYLPVNIPCQTTSPHPLGAIDC